MLGISEYYLDRAFLLCESGDSFLNFSENINDVFHSFEKLTERFDFVNKCKMDF